MYHPSSTTQAWSFAWQTLQDAAGPPSQPVFGNLMLYLDFRFLSQPKTHEASMPCPVTISPISD